jgi:hypothetical protein
MGWRHLLVCMATFISVAKCPVLGRDRVFMRMKLEESIAVGGLEDGSRRSQSQGAGKLHTTNTLQI